MKKKILICTPTNCELGGVQNYIYNTLKNINIKDFEIHIFFSGTNKDAQYNINFTNLKLLKTLFLYLPIHFFKNFITIYL